jgi:hypothetical protein
LARTTSIGVLAADGPDAGDGWALVNVEAA